MSTDITFHEQLLGKLRQLISSRRFAPGAKFLTEREVAARFQTSRPTANKALSRLVSEGLIEFRRGAGTFVREGALDYDLQRLVSFTEKARAAGRKPATKVTVFRKLHGADVSPELREALHLSDDDAVIYMERQRLADGRPVIFERRYVSVRHSGPMTRAEASGSLYAFWTEKRRLTISGASESIRAVNADKSQAAMLGVAVNAACLLVLGTGFADADKPLWHEETLYRADVYEFRNQLGGIAAPRPAMGRIRA